MSDINRWTAVGRLTRDPETRSAGESSVTRFGFAVNRKYKQAEEVLFIDVNVWGAQGQSCQKHLSKGRVVAVDGRLKQESWEKDGVKHSRIVVIADTVQFLGAGKSSAGQQVADGFDGTADAPDGDIPF